MEGDYNIEYHSVNRVEDVCFTHAVHRVIRGEEIRTKVAERHEYYFYRCVDCDAEIKAKYG